MFVCRGDTDATNNQGEFVMSCSSNIVIHINQTMDQPNREKFKGLVRQLQGVVSAKIEGSRPHLLIVGYDLDETKPIDIVKSVRNKGVQAQLIAWL